MKTLLTLPLVLFSATSMLHAAPLKTGFAERDISPDIGMERPGGYTKGFHQKFHDACKARAVVFDDGQKAVAMVGLDALFIMGPQVAEIRRQIHEKTGIKPEAVLIGASHSHSSGPTGMVLPGQYDHADKLVQRLAYEESSAADPKYLKRVEKGIVEAVVEAFEKRGDLQIGFGRGREDSVSFNRRWRMKNGESFTHPRYGNPDAIKPAGPIDPEVGVIGAWDAEGKLKGCVVNFACHATASPRGISANWPWAMEKVIRGAFGGDVIVVFLNGDSGDVTQVDNASPYARVSGEPDTLKVGGRVGAEAVKVLVGIQAPMRSPEAAIDYRDAVLKIPRRKPSAERSKKCRALVEKGRPKDAAGINDWIWAKEIVMLNALIKQEPVRDVEVQTIQVGPAVFITSPAEYFCEFGLQEKKASKFPFTWPVSLANACMGYVPTSEAFSPSGGGYETRLTAYSNLIPDAGNQIRDKGIELANSMKPGPVKKPNPAPPFTGGWRYGSVPPELD